jgi:hypothetical protein
MVKGGASIGKATYKLDFKSFTPYEATNYEKIEASLVSVSGVGAGAGPGFGLTHVNVAAPRIAHFAPNTQVVIDSPGQDVPLVFTSTLQLGAKIAVTAGTLISGRLIFSQTFKDGQSTT